MDEIIRMRLEIKYDCISQVVEMQEIGKNHLVLVGAGHSNLHLVKNVSKLQKNGFRITLISPTDFYYNGVAPGVLSNFYPERFGKIDVQCHLDVEDSQYLKFDVKKVNVKDNKIYSHDNQSVHFDYLSINIGGSVPLEKIPGSEEFVFPIRPISKFWEFSAKLKQSIEEGSKKDFTIIIIGGGAAGVEITGNVWDLFNTKGVKSRIVLVTGGDSILTQFPIAAQKKVLNLFSKREIHVKLNSRVIKIQENLIVTESEEELSFDYCILASGVIPNTLDSQNSLLTTKMGELIVTSFLQCKNYSHIFATGDCSYFEDQPLWKSGYHAINQGPILLKNLIASTKGKKLHKYKPSKRIITALNLGDGIGLIIYGRFTLLSRFSLKVKDFIEKRYIKSAKCSE